MKLSHLCDMEWRHDFAESMDPSDRGDGRLYGQGTATLTGQLAGTATRPNFATRRGGGFAHPNACGVIEVESGGTVLFEVHGRSAPDAGRGIHVLTFQTELDKWARPDEVVAIGEGSIEPERLVLAMRYYVCEVDYLPKLG